VRMMLVPGQGLSQDNTLTAQHMHFHISTGLCLLCGWETPTACASSVRRGGTPTTTHSYPPWISTMPLITLPRRAILGLLGHA
jgi:hypothetical protein